jgi:hypothetical protein
MVSLFLLGILNLKYLLSSMSSGHDFGLTENFILEIRYFVQKIIVDMGGIVDHRCLIFL